MTKKLIALAVIAAGVLAANSPEIQANASFEAPDDVADQLIKDGLAKEDVPAAAKVKTVKARVLVDGPYGKPNDVIDIPASDAKEAVANGLVDTTKEAVAYATTLEQNQGKA